MSTATPSPEQRRVEPNDAPMAWRLLRVFENAIGAPSRRLEAAPTPSTRRHAIDAAVDAMSHNTQRHPGNARFLERFSPERRAYLDLKLRVAASRGNAGSTASRWTYRRDAVGERGTWTCRDKNNTQAPRPHAADAEPRLARRTRGDVAAAQGGLDA